MILVMVNCNCRGTSQTMLPGSLNDAFLISKLLIEDFDFPSDEGMILLHVFNSCLHQELAPTDFEVSITWACRQHQASDRRPQRSLPQAHAEQHPQRV